MPTAIGAHSTLRLYIAGAWLAGWAGLGGEERCWQGQGGWFLFFSSYGAGSPGLWERRTGTRASQRIWRSRGPHDGVTARGGKVDAQLSSPGGLISPVISPNRHPSFRDLHISPILLFQSPVMPRTHQTFHPVQAVKFLGIMFKNRCWSTGFHTITAWDVDGGCQKWPVWSSPHAPITPSFPSGSSC